MKLFSFFKKQKRQVSELTLSAILKRTLEYVPDFYRESQRYLDSQEFFEQHEFGLSLDSLIRSNPQERANR